MTNIDSRKTGDSKMPRPTMPPVPARHHDAAQASARPRELHPAAADTIERIHLVWEENDKLRAENNQLTKDNEVLKRVDAEKTKLISDLRQQLDNTQKTTDIRVQDVETHFRERLAESERAKERYLRYAVSISERLKAAGDDITAAHEAAMDMAGKSLDQTISEIETGMAKMVQQKE